jgi:hypothetical protein
MTDMPKTQMTHPDDMMTVCVSLDFTAEINPEAEDAPPLDTVCVESIFNAADAEVYLEEVIAAIRGRRLFGFMAQEAAINAVRSGEWIQGSIEIFGAERATDDEVKDQ